MDLLCSFFFIACILHDSSSASSQCLDKSAKCADYAAYCEHTSYKNSLRSACALTCGYCTAEGNATSQSYDTDSSSASSQCLDKSAKCADYAAYCEHTSYKNSLRSACALTCGYCTPEGNVTSQSYETECSDESAKCAALAIYCKDPDMQSCLKSACALTCGYCSPENNDTTQADGAGVDGLDLAGTTHTTASDNSMSNVTITTSSATAISIGDDVQCSHGKMTPRQRAVFLHNLNTYRSKFLRHMESVGGKKWIAASTKNMYKLSWDCELEKSSETWVETCPSQHKPHSGNPGSKYGESITFVWSALEDFGLTADQVMEKAADYCWYQPEQDGKAGFYTIRIGDGRHMGQCHITEMMWGTTTRVGCSYSMHCNDEYDGKTATVCCQYMPRGSDLDNPSREPGRSCQRAADCTAYNGSSCEVSTGLCTLP